MLVRSNKIIQLSAWIWKQVSESIDEDIIKILT